MGFQRLRLVLFMGLLLLLTQFVSAFPITNPPPDTGDLIPRAVPQQSPPKPTTTPPKTPQPISSQSPAKADDKTKPLQKSLKPASTSVKAVKSASPSSKKKLVSETIQSGKTSNGQPPKASLQQLNLAKRVGALQQNQNVSGTKKTKSPQLSRSQAGASPKANGAKKGSGSTTPKILSSTSGSGKHGSKTKKPEYEEVKAMGFGDSKVDGFQAVYTGKKGSKKPKATNGEVWTHASETEEVNQHLNRNQLADYTEAERVKYDNLLNKENKGKKGKDQLTKAGNISVQEYEDPKTKEWMLQTDTSGRISPDYRGKAKNWKPGTDDVGASLNAKHGPKGKKGMDSEYYATMEIAKATGTNEFKGEDLVDSMDPSTGELKRSCKICYATIREHNATDTTRPKDDEYATKHPKELNEWAQKWNGDNTKNGAFNGSQFQVNSGVPFSQVTA